MGNSPNRKGFTVHETLKKQLLVYQKDHKYKSPSFTKFIEELLEDVIRRDRVVKDIFPNFSEISFDENVLTIKDDLDTDLLIQITLKNKKLYCSVDKSARCDHIDFALSLPAVGKLGIKPEYDENIEHDGVKVKKALIKSK